MHVFRSPRVFFGFVLTLLVGCSSDSNRTAPALDAQIGTVMDASASIDMDQFDVGVDAQREAPAVNPPSGPSIIQRVQQGLIEEGASVMLTNVIVTAVAGEEGFFVSDGTDAPYSGVYVYHPNTTALELKVGDLVTFVGVVKEYFDLTEIALNADAEVRIDGEGLPPLPVSLSMDELCDPETAEPWEGMLVSVDNLTVTDVAVFGGFEFESEAGSCELAASPTVGQITLGRLSLGQGITQLTGLLHYTFEAFKLLPRSDDDVVTVMLATGVVTIDQIRNGEVPMRSRVSLSGVTVIGFDDYYIYVADPIGGAKSGLQIIDADRNTAVMVGHKIDLDLQVLSNQTGRMILSRVTGGSTGPEPRVLQPAQLESEDYLYTLVSIETLVVTEAEPAIDFSEDGDEARLLGNPNAAFELSFATVSKEFFTPDFPFLRTGDRFEKVTGIQLRHAYDILDEGELATREAIAIAPRSEQDFEGYVSACEADACAPDLAEGDLVITEIAYGGDCEWVELKNTRMDDIDLTNLRIGERDRGQLGARPFVFGTHILPAQSYALVGCLPTCVEGILHIESDLGGQLANAGDTIEVWTNTTLLDSVTYSPGRTNGLQLLAGTIEGHPGDEIAGQNDDPTYWCDAIFHPQCGIIGTPGAANQCDHRCMPDLCTGDLMTGDVVISEIMAAPVGGGSDCEWIELTNTTNQKVHLGGLLLVDGDPNLFRSPNILGGFIEPNGAAVLMKDAESCDSLCAPNAVGSWRQHATLNNNSDTLTLAVGDRVIDRVQYSSPVVAVSLQRLSNTDGNAWCSAIDVSPDCPEARATPGQPNRCE